MPRVLVVATSHKTRGGITSVVKAHQQGLQWNEFHCKWIETHIDKGLFLKFLKVIPAFFEFLFLLPFYDLVHIHLSEPPSAMRKIIFVWLAKLFSKKTVIHFHSFSVETTIRSKYAFLYKFLFARADRVVVLSEYWKKEVEAVFPFVKVQVIYNPCPSSRSISSLNSNPSCTQSKKCSILYAGTICHRKGYDDMIKAFARIAMKYPDWQIVFAGNGEVEKGKLLAKELNVSDQVVWLGWVNGLDKEKAFRDATVFCLPSYAEGFPMSVLDAWSFGLPVITTPVGGIPDVSKDGKNMLLFSPGDVEKLSNCMERIITDRNLRESIAKESVRFAETMFNINTINKQIGDLYNQLLSEKEM